ncbi:MFS-type transporter clz9-like [Leptopilina heterotoma]|uniref:MFS-type transporter clz9-like n=1 Tax=Leptopilina heterotoma TaxID=63436 RepID=UPI001CA861C7|nr:MFS-type transporter clz9-like [Leptopilina heterotoma]
MPATKTELLDSVQNYVTLLKKKTPFADNRPSRHWYESFRKRHPQLTLRKPQNLSTSRAAVSKEDLQEWFEEQEKYLREKNLLDIPSSRVFNCDETNIVLCPESEKVITEVGARSVYRIVDSEKESLTVLFMYSANGIRVPPMLMYSYQGVIPKNIVDNTPKGWGIGVSENGWMTTETFYEYITNVFYPWLVQEKIQFPVIIYLDNHSSHITIPLVKFCRDKQIEIIGLFPNSTHVMQPLDISFFNPFKVAWKKLCRSGKF